MNKMDPKTVKVLQKLGSEKTDLSVSSIGRIVSAQKSNRTTREKLISQSEKLKSQLKKIGDEVLHQQEGIEYDMDQLSDAIADLREFMQKIGTDVPEARQALEDKRQLCIDTYNKLSKDLSDLKSVYTSLGNVK